jgi:hypothetical protein
MIISLTVFDGNVGELVLNASYGLMKIRRRDKANG